MVIVGATHPILSGNCIEKLEKVGVKDILVSNTIEKRIKKGVNLIDIKDILLDVFQ